MAHNVSTNAGQETQVDLGVTWPTPGAHHLAYAEWAQAVNHGLLWLCRPPGRHPKHSIGSQRMIQPTVMSKAVIPRQPQGQSGRCSGHAHGDGWASRARRGRWVRHSAASGSPLRGVTRPGGPDIKSRLARDSGRVAGEAFSRLAACQTSTSRLRQRASNRTSSG